MRRSEQGTNRTWLPIGVLAVVFALGLVGLFGLWGRPQDDWGYYAGTLAFILSSAQGAPLVSVALRLTKGHWGRPIYRMADILALGGILSFLMFLPLTAVLPQGRDRISIWFGWPVGAPWFWDGLALFSLALCGLAIVCLGALPDWASQRGGAGAWGWRGTARQWRVLKSGLVLLGVLYLIGFVVAQTLVSAELAMSLVPGWRSAIFPPFQTIAGIQGGVALTLVTMLWLRRSPRMGGHLGLDQFWGMAKILLALSLLWFYFWWSEFIVQWYGRMPVERSILERLTFGPHPAFFAIVFALSFLIPLLVLLWNRARRSVWGPSFVAVGALAGLFLDKMRLYAFAFAGGDGYRLPNEVELLAMVGALAGVGLVYLLAARWVPLLSRWEVGEGLLLRRERLAWGATMTVVAKPE